MLEISGLEKCWKHWQNKKPVVWDTIGVAWASGVPKKGVKRLKSQIMGQSMSCLSSQGSWKACFLSGAPVYNWWSIISKPICFSASPLNAKSCLLKNTDDWYSGLDLGQLIGLVIIDFKKAFDTVNHDIPCLKVYERAWNSVSFYLSQKSSSLNLLLLDVAENKARNLQTSFELQPKHSETFQQKEYKDTFSAMSSSAFEIRRRGRAFPSFPSAIFLPSFWSSQDLAFRG